MKAIIKIAGQVVGEADVDINQDKDQVSKPLWVGDFSRSFKVEISKQKALALRKAYLSYLGRYLKKKKLPRKLKKRLKKQQ